MVLYESKSTLLRLFFLPYRRGNFASATSVATCRTRAVARVPLVDEFRPRGLSETRRVRPRESAPCQSSITIVTIVTIAQTRSDHQFTRVSWNRVERRQFGATSLPHGTGTSHSSIRLSIPAWNCDLTRQLNAPSSGDREGESPTTSSPEN